MNMASIQNSALNAAGSVKNLFVTTDSKSGKSEWNGRNIAIATGAAGSLLTGVAVAMRYGTSPTAILEGLKGDGSSALTGLGQAKEFTVTKLGDAATFAKTGLVDAGNYALAVPGRVSTAFTTTFSSENMSVLSGKFEALPGQISERISSGFGVIGSQITSLSDKVTEGFASVSNRLLALEELLGRKSS